MQTARSPRHERLTELVTHLSGAPMPSARDAVAQAMDHHGPDGDNLLDVAAALVTLKA